MTVLLILQETPEDTLATSVLWTTADPVSLLVVGAVGLMLLLFGGRLFRPCLVLAAAVAGAMLGLQLASATRAGTLPGWAMNASIPPLVWVIGMPLVAGLLAAVFSRVVLAILIGVLGVGGVLLIAAAVFGSDGPPAGSGSNAGATAVSWRVERQTQEEPAAQDDDRGLLEGIRAAAVEEIGGQVVDAATERGLEKVDEARRRMIGLTDSLFGELRAWWSARTSHVAPAMLDLVMAIAVVVGIAGFIVALLRPVLVASIGTAFLGGWMLMACGAVLWSRVSSTGDLPSPFLMLLGWGFATAVGLLVQASTRSARKPAAASSAED